MTNGIPTSASPFTCRDLSGTIVIALLGLTQIYETVGSFLPNVLALCVYC